MNTFNDVFLAVKKYSDSKEVIPDCFAFIAYHSDVHISKLDFYLNCLQDLGLINTHGRVRLFTLQHLEKCKKDYLLKDKT
jgi:hypothetical protein